jgi:hypothetical protein
MRFSSAASSVVVSIVSSDNTCRPNSHHLLYSPYLIGAVATTPRPSLNVDNLLLVVVGLAW